jgi:hypothetical protein
VNGKPPCAVATPSWASSSGLWLFLFSARPFERDIGFNRIPRASFQRALVRNGRKAIVGEDSVGKPAKQGVLFCRDPISEADHPENYYQTPCQALNLEQLPKLMIMYELHGLNDIAVDTVERFADRLNRYVLSPMCSGWTHGLWGRQGSRTPALLL